VKTIRKAILHSLIVSAVTMVCFAAPKSIRASPRPEQSDATEHAVVGGWDYTEKGRDRNRHCSSNLLYVPVKLVYGILGGITGGAGYAVSGDNEQVAQTIWRSSLAVLISMGLLPRH
jgi:hypothetical protein